MFVVLEGIDGAGKTTISSGLAAMLRADGDCVAEVIRKEPDAVTDAPAADRLRGLHEIIWGDRESEPVQDVFGTYYHLFLHAAWFAAMDRCRIQPSRARGGTFMIADGWYYRSVVKANVRERIGEDWALSLFEHSGPPDLVILVDVDPSVAWDRRKGNFRPSESGRWDGHSGDQREAFIAYQSEIRAGLLRFASQAFWRTVQVTSEMTPEDVLLEVRRTIMECAGRAN